ncbi:MAG: hypothetical protein M0R73_11165 [Dehalococcoidia bacterium]|nr:hypothetical protein [Dehalococcoidia bacterium]
MQPAATREAQHTVERHEVEHHEAERGAEPRRLADRAADNLRFIRQAMEGASRFTEISGAGMVAIGLTALLATVVAAAQETDRASALVWQVEAGVAVAIGLAATLYKVRAQRGGGWKRLLAAPARKFALGLAPPLAAGAVLTVVLQHEGLYYLLPGTWLLLYGAAIAAAGASSVRLLPALGLAFMAAGLAGFAAPEGWGWWIMGAGFGGLHVAFGAVIARRYGG